MHLSRVLQLPLLALETLIAVVFSPLRAILTYFTGQNKTLFLFYDLEVCPITYDIASYLAVAELERRRRRLRGIHVIVVPGRRLDYEEADYDAAVSPAERRFRLRNIAVPVLELLPTCTGHTFCSGRGHAMALRLFVAANMLPDGYRPYFPVALDHRPVRDAARDGVPVFPILRANQASLTFARQFLERDELEGRRIIVVTLREYGYMPARNSNLASWTQFADSLDPKRYAVVFVRDTSRSLTAIPSELKGRIICDAASWNIPLRMALYELAYLNMAIMHGPMELCWYNEMCRYVVFVKIGSAPQTTLEAFKRYGYDIGRSLPFAGSCQRWVWEPDDWAVLEREFATMEQLIDASDAAIPREKQTTPRD